MARKWPGLVHLVMTSLPKYRGADAINLIVTMLADWLLLTDDCGSMMSEDSRIGQLREVGRGLALIGGYCDSNAYQMRAFATDLSAVLRGEGDSKPLQDHCKDQNDFDPLVENIRFAHLTPMGEQTKAKIHNPLVLDKIKTNTLHNPVIVWYTTDGQPYPEIEHIMSNAYADTYKKLEKTKLVIGALMNIKVLVGPVKPAAGVALKLDNDSRWVGSFDTVMPLEQWIAMTSARHPDSEFNFYMWLTKKFVGHSVKK